MTGLSDSDTAFSLFRDLLGRRQILRAGDPKLSEADTRAKLIDPVFKDVLGWSEPEIRREEPAVSGFADYLCGLDTAYLLIEAKRTVPRFKLKVSSKSRKLKLNGPHLLRHAKMRLPLEQAQRYASNLGAHIAVLTNGSQYLLFRPYLPGRSWKNGIAVVFYDENDVLQDFATFYSMLSRDAVVSGASLDAFEELEGITENLYPPIQFVHRPDEELVRNPFWPRISKIFAPLLTDQSEDPSAQQEVIIHCYVTTKLSDQTDANLDRLLRDLPTEMLKGARVEHTDSSKRAPFARHIHNDIEGYRPGTYLLTGGVGSGKTTFLRRFALVVDPTFLAKYCVWIHIDFLTIGSTAESTPDADIRRFVYRRIREEIELRYQERMPKDGAALRRLFSVELARAGRTSLYGMPQDSPDRIAREGQIVDSLYNSDSEFAVALLRDVHAKGLRLVIVLDNTDQQGETFQERVFLEAQRLSKEHKALAIVALREERFFAAYRRGIFDAFGDRRFHIGSPELRWVLKERLNYGRQKLNEAADAGILALRSDERDQVDRLLAAVIRSTTQKNANIVRMLACVSNGDMRYALDMFREFLSSGNTNVQKILDIMSRSGGYTVPFHEFAKSAILGSRRYYRSSRSHIVNIFKKSASRRASHITGLRILARLSRAEEAASPHGEGFVRTETLLHEYRSSFGYAEDFEQVSGEFVRRGLIESEPPRAPEVAQAVALRIAASGSYYWRYLVRAFAYVDLAWIDTPIADRELAKRLAGLAEATDFTVRFERVRAFLDYLVEQERVELIEVAKRSGPYREALVPQLVDQIEREIKLIAEKTRTIDSFAKS